MDAQYDVEADINAVREACKGAGTNEKALIALLCNRPRSYVRQLNHEYRQRHHERLLDLLIRELSGKLEFAFESLVRESADLRRVYIHRAVQGAGTDKGLLIDCLLAASPAEIKEVKEEWKDKFFIPIIARLAIDGVLLGGVHDLLEHSLADHKPASGVEHDKVASDIDALYKAGEGKIGTDEKAITKIFAHRSREHLIFLDGEYKNKSPKKKSLSEVIMAETSGDLELALLASMSPLSDYHARRLNDSMKGVGTDEEKLICHVFLPEAHLFRDVAASYKRLYGKNLVDVVASEVSGDLKDMLVTYIKFHTK